MPDAYDVVIRGATVYDGSGGEPRVADVAVRGDRVAAVGEVAERAGVEVAGRGLALAPGFIDVHAHDDLAVFLWPEMDFKVMQGVTTDVVGNCGMGAAPGEEGRRNVAAFDPEGTLPAWDDYGQYMAAIDADPPSCNVAVLMGHGTARAAAMGNAERAPTASEAAAMRDLFAEGMAAGAVGMSTGLIYEPGRYAPTEEIVALARVVAEAGGLYATHMRNEGAQLLAAVEEALQIGREAGAPVQISHHKASGRQNWGRVRESLALIEAARAEGLDVTADQYPYTAGSTLLAAIVQNGAFAADGGGESGVGSLAASELRIASAPRRPEWEGQTLQALCDAFDLPAEETAQRVLDAAGPGVWAIIETMDEADVRTVLAHPTTMIGSDGIPATGANPHPRLYGTFPRVLGRYARDVGVLSMSEAIHRMTGLPARKFGLAGRGEVAVGAVADLVVFDPATIGDVGTYDDPRRYPSGVRHVLVNGTFVVREGTHTGARPGRVAVRSNRGVAPA